MISKQVPRVLVPSGSSKRHYEVLQELASGDRTTVVLAYRCEDGLTDQLVAVKRALRDGSDAAAALAQEAHLASSVRHPNVVAVHDVEPLGDSLFLVLEYVEGLPLHVMARAARLSPRVVARIVQDTCEGLGAIHAATNQSSKKLDLLHGHVTAENVLVGTDGVSRLTDFGSASSNRTPRQARSGIWKSAGRYPGPERGTSGEATPGDDVYALGVVAWEAFTGRPLYPGRPTRGALEREDLPAPNVSASLDAFLLRALGHSALPRFQEARALGHALSLACAGDVASRREVSEVVERLGAETFRVRRDRLR